MTIKEKPIKSVAKSLKNTASTSREAGERNIQSRCGWPFSIIFVSILCVTTAHIWFPSILDYFQSIVHNLPGPFANATVSSLTAVIVVGLLIVLCIRSGFGPFIGSFREWGISHLYIPLWKKRKNGKTPEKPGRMERKVFYLFRIGSALQTCMDIARNEQEKYQWIKDSLDRNKGIRNNSLRNDMWNLAERIRMYDPRTPKFVFFAYFRNLEFQMADTFCLLVSLVCFCIFMVNTTKVVIDYAILQKQIVLVSTLIPLTLAFVFSFLMVIFKNSSIGAAVTFLNAIEGGFMAILEEVRSMEVNTDQDSRFIIGVSFCGEHRTSIVLPVVNELLRRRYTKNDIFYDSWHDHLIVGPGGDMKIKEIYGEKCDAIVVFLSKEYNSKTWTGGIEWSAIRVLINEKKQEAVCLLNVDGVDINTIDNLNSSTDIAKKIDTLNASEIADFIWLWHKQYLNHKEEREV